MAIGNIASVSAKVGMKIQATLVLEDDASDAAYATGNKKPVGDNWDAEDTLSGSSTPDLDVVCFTKVTLSGGSKTLDLTATVDVSGVTFDFTGKKLCLLRIYNPSANSVNITAGAANPYTDFWGTSNDLDLDAGEEIMKRVRDSNSNPNAAVSATVKNIDWSGTGTDFFLVTMGFGD